MSPNAFDATPQTGRRAVSSRRENRRPYRQAYREARAAARRLGLGPGDAVVAGVSGGPDSTALLLILGDIARRAGFRLHIAHLIHDFRGQEARDDADFVRRLAAQNGLPCTVDEADVPAYQRRRGVSSFEQAARDLRYAFLARVARSAGAGTVAVGHTADDQAETVLLHIARGSGLHGLRGMREISPWPYPHAAADGRGSGDSDRGNINDSALAAGEVAVAPLPRLWRPLLALRRADTIACCRAQGIDYRDDRTNYMPDFARNRVRLNIMPALSEHLNPQIADALARLASTASASLEYMEEQAAAHWPAVAPEPPSAGGTLRLNRSALAGVHPALRSLLLRRAWATVTGSTRRLTERHLQQLANIAGAGNGPGRTLSLPGGYAARAGREWLTLGPAPAKASPARWAPPDGGDDDNDDCPYPALGGEFRLTLPFGPVVEAVTRRDGWEATCRAVTLPPEASVDTGDPLAAYLAPAALSGGATVRVWQPGDRMQPLGMAGRRKLQDIFIDAGVPRGWRRRIPLVVTPAGIAWVAGVRLAEWAALPPAEGREPERGRPAILIRFALSSPDADADADARAP